MFEVKKVIEMNLETVCEVFEGLELCIEFANNEPIAISTEDEVYVVMTGEDFACLKANHNPVSAFHLSCDMLDELETLSICELENILSLVSSQLNLKLARQYAKQ